MISLEDTPKTINVGFIHGLVHNYVDTIVLFSVLNLAIHRIDVHFLLLFIFQLLIIMYL